MSDYYDDAMNATYEERPKMAFGQVSVDVFPCVLVKGTGKVQFDEGLHRPEDRRTSIHITISPLASSGLTFNTEREMIAESKEWAGIVKPSLVALNTDLRTVNGKWVKVLLVPTGQTYVNKQGEKKERTTVKFEAVYASEADCDKAAAEFFKKAPEEPVPGFDSPAPAGGSANGSNGTNGNGHNAGERDAALKFLPALWNGSGKDVEKFAASISKNPLVCKYFDLNSPEVIQLIAAAA
jgi:hypothetical protein